jgi:hypothetical protein
MNMPADITEEEAKKIPIGEWPTQLGCERDANNNYTGYRWEAIGTSDKGEIRRKYEDGSCV